MYCCSTLRETQKNGASQRPELTTYHPGESLVLDSSTIHNLELFATLREGSKEGSLLYQLDQTQTAMGGRLLHQWVRQPLQQRDKIEERLSSVEYWLTQTTQRERVQELLTGLADLDRLLSRLALGQGTPPHLVQLPQSLERVKLIRTELTPVADPLTTQLTAALSVHLDQVAQLIARTIDPDATIDPKSGGVIQDGVSAQLDELCQIMRHSQDWIKSLEKTEREQTGISSLKVRSNKVFGFYLEVTHTHRDKVPEYYERKQTLVNSERYITPQLKEHEEKLLTADEVTNELE